MGLPLDSKDQKESLHVACVGPSCTSYESPSAAPSPQKDLERANSNPSTNMTCMARDPCQPPRVMLSAVQPSSHRCKNLVSQGSHCAAHIAASCGQARLAASNHVDRKALRWAFSRSIGITTSPSCPSLGAGAMFFAQPRTMRTINAATSSVPSSKLVGSTPLKSLSMCSSITQLSVNFIKTSASAMGRSLLLRFFQNTRIEMEITTNVNYSHVCVGWRRLHLSPLCKPRVSQSAITARPKKPSFRLSYSRWPSIAQSLPKAETPWTSLMLPLGRPCKSSNNTNGVMAPRPALNRMAEFGAVGLDHHCHHKVVKRPSCSSSTSHSHSS